MTDPTPDRIRQAMAVIEEIWPAFDPESPASAVISGLRFHAEERERLARAEELADELKELIAPHSTVFSYLGMAQTLIERYPALLKKKGT